MKSTSIFKGAAFVASMTVFAGVAQADMVQVRDAAGGNGYFLNGTVKGTARISKNGGSSYYNQPLGTYGFEMDQGAGWQALETYCIELTQVISFGNGNNDTGGLPHEVVEVDSLARFTSDEAVAIETLWGSAFDLSKQSKVGSNAFQVILWELSMDDVFDLSDGSFRVDTSHSHTNDVAVQAAQWWSDIELGVFTERVALKALVSDQSQDYLVPTNNIPGPGSLALLSAAGMIGLRKRNRK